MENQEEESQGSSFKGEKLPMEINEPSAMLCERFQEAVLGGDRGMLILTVPAVDRRQLKKVAEFLWMHGEVIESSPPAAIDRLQILQKFEDSIFLADETLTSLAQMEACAEFLRVPGMLAIVRAQMNPLMSRPPSPPGPEYYLLESMGSVLHTIPGRAAVLSPWIRRAVQEDPSAAMTQFYVDVPSTVLHKVVLYLMKHCDFNPTPLQSAQLLHWENTVFLYTNDGGFDLLDLLKAAKFLEVRPMYTIVKMKLNSLGVPIPLDLVIPPP